LIESVIIWREKQSNHFLDMFQRRRYKDIDLIFTFLRC